MRQRLVLWPALGLLACTPMSDVTVEGDTLRVRANGRPIWGTDVRLVEEFTIGQVDGPPEYAFGSVYRLAVDATGAFYVFDEQEPPQIRKYDAEGRFLFNVGRSGDGPGEYRSGEMTVAQDSLLIFCSPGHRRMTVFGPDGTVRSIVSLHDRYFLGENDCLADAGGLVFRRSPRILLEGSTGFGKAATMLRLRLDGSVADSFYMPPRATESMSVTLTTDGPLHAFAAESIGVPYAVGGMIIGHSESYRVVVTRPGARVMVIERRSPRIPLQGAEREEWIARIECYEGAGRAAAQRGLGAPPPEPSLPEEKPYFRDLSSDLSGRIWVHLYAEAERRNVEPRPGNPCPPLTWRERNTYDVFSGDGEYLGRVRLPPENMLLAIRGGRLYARLTGPQGEHRVAVYRLP